MITSVAKLSIIGFRWSSSRVALPPTTDFWTEYAARCQTVRNGNKGKTDIMVTQHARFMREVFDCVDSPHLTVSDKMSPSSIRLSATERCVTIHFRPVDMPLTDMSAELRRMYTAVCDLNVSDMILVIDFMDIDGPAAQAIATALTARGVLWSILDFWCSIPAKPKKVCVIKPEQASLFVNPFAALVKRSLSPKLQSRIYTFSDANKCPHKIENQTLESSSTARDDA